MTYRKSDGAFGLLPKKTAMDLEWPAGSRLSALQGKETDPAGHRAPESELPHRVEGEALPWTKTQLT